MELERTDGTTLFYDIAGEGDGLVLVHGSWGERQTWGFVIPALAGSFRVVSYDRRGHGESTTRPDEGTVHDDVADLAAMIDALGPRPVHLVANSYGACIALRLAAAHPQLVARMVCHEPPMLGVLDADPEGKPIADEARRKMSEVGQRLERGDHAGGAEHFVDHVAIGPGSWAQFPAPMQQMFVRHAPTFLGELRDAEALAADLDALRGLEAPVLLTYGDQSPAFFAPIVERLDGILPNARLQLLPGAGHVPHMTHPDEYVPAVRDFLLDRPG